MSLRELLIEIDFNRIRKWLDRALAECAKYSSVSEVVIPQSQLLAVKVVCLEVLADANYQPVCYHFLKLREQAIDKYSTLFCRVSLEKCVKQTLQLAISLAAANRSQNWLIKATYHKYVQSLMVKYCNSSYLSQAIINALT